MASAALSSTLSRESADSFWDDDDVPAHRTDPYDPESTHLARSAGPDGRSGLADSPDGELDSLMPGGGLRSAHLGAARAENGQRADDYLHGADGRLGHGGGGGEFGGREAGKRLREREMERAFRGWPSCWQIWGEILDQMELGAPLSAANLLSFARFLFSLAFLGRRSTLLLAAAAVAITFTNVTGFSLLIGLASGIEPLCAQAHGAQQPKTMGLLLRRSSLLLTLASIPIAILWFNSQALLLAAGQDGPLVSEAATFILWLLPDLFLSALVNPLRIFLRAQGIVRPVLVGAALSLAVHVLATWLLVAGPVRLGCAGAAAAASISDLFLWLLMLFYLHCFTDVPRRCGLLVPLSFSATPLTPAAAAAAAAAAAGVSSPRSPRPSISSTFPISPASPASPLSPTRHLSARPSVLAQWGPLIRMSLPACATICLEWWCYELCMLLSGLLPDATTSVAALAILFNLDSILYSLTAGLAAAAGTRAGNLLGSAFPILARNAALVALGCSLLLGVTQLAVLWAAREPLGHVFTQDAAVLEVVTALLPILGLLEVFNSVQTVMTGLLRGCGRPDVGMYVNLGAFYVLGLPLGLGLCFLADLGLLGLVLGLLAAVVTCSFFTVSAVLSTDWKAEASKATARIGPLPVAAIADVLSPRGGMVGEGMATHRRNRVEEGMYGVREEEEEGEEKNGAGEREQEMAALTGSRLNKFDQVL
ncbi:hypothetical protein CLOM_g17300 [Closterium sp. NIES-68]|nr:hypothetical protein CLOM_g17300 [Closterium sp. NIES-68]GJP86220.1 hypothetical protein CLOP_g16270 [Closterium sp. NIES-67]